MNSVYIYCICGFFLFFLHFNLNMARNTNKIVEESLVSLVLSVSTIMFLHLHYTEQEVLCEMVKNKSHFLTN